jgi:hypothetical protein
MTPDAALREWLDDVDVFFEALIADTRNGDRVNLRAAHAARRSLENARTALSGAEPSTKRAGNVNGREDAEAKKGTGATPESLRALVTKWRTAARHNPPLIEHVIMQCAAELADALEAAAAAHEEKS